MSYNIDGLPIANVTEFVKTSLSHFRWDVLLLQEPGPVNALVSEEWGPHLLIQSSQWHAIVIHSSVLHLLAHNDTDETADHVYLRNSSDTNEVTQFTSTYLPCSKYNFNTYSAAIQNLARGMANVPDGFSVVHRVAGIDAQVPLPSSHGNVTGNQIHRSTTLTNKALDFISFLMEHDFCAVNTFDTTRFDYLLPMDHCDVNGVVSCWTHRHHAH